MGRSNLDITASSTAEYFSKNLQQVGFSSPTKAVLTTLKESIDNSLDACEDGGILPEIVVIVEKIGAGPHRNTDLIRIRVEDNGPGLEEENIPRVFGEYLASSKFGRGRCSRGQQGIGISAATTWAQLTSAKGANIVSKTKRMRKAIKGTVVVDIKHNKGVLKNKETIDWEKPHGLDCEFIIEGRIQLNGEAGLITYLTGVTLVNPHLNLSYKLPDQEVIKVERVSKKCPVIPDATDPHPHTMKLGEFIHHSHLFGKMPVKRWLKKGFSRISDNVIDELVKNGLEKHVLMQSCNKTKESEYKQLYSVLQKIDLMNPSTKAVMSIGEDALAQSIGRLGDVDFFSVVTRKPTICDAKPVSVEVAIARLKDGRGEDEAVTALRFANRVPLQFDKSACAMFKAIASITWRSYGLQQAKGALPSGPYVIAVSLVSPFIKFKNASKETVDASEELVEEIRRALMQAGQRLSRHIKREYRAADLERKIQHIEQFCPILVACLCRITNASPKQKQKATDGLIKLLGRDVNRAEKDLKEAVKHAKAFERAGKLRSVDSGKVEEEEDVIAVEVPVEEEQEQSRVTAKGKAKKKRKKPESRKKNETKQIEMAI